MAVQESSRRRRLMTVALMIIPCILSILTVLSVWILPSSSLNGGFLRHFTGDSDESRATTTRTNQLQSNPKISHPTRTRNKKTNNPTDATTAVAIVSVSKANWTMVPQQLLDMGVYDEASDFVNEQGIVPTGWEHANGDHDVWGPCRFVPSTPTSLEWSDRRRNNSTTNNNTATMMSPEYYRNADLNDFDYLRNPKKQSHNKGKSGIGWCRPGFLIIGAGKCGTSSLYHYLVGHPRVLPAFEKQIHYFKYLDRRQPLEFYYGHFPTPQSFLEHGGLVTGEASPGYLPYPDVARDAYKTWKGSASDGAGMASIGKPLSQFLASPSYKWMVPEVSPRIIALGREPVDRIYSSYKYNYVVPTIESLRTRGHPRIPTATKKQSLFVKKKRGVDKEGEFQLNREDDEYYLPYLFTLEEFVRAELKQLRGCLDDWGPRETYNKWHRDAAYKDALQLRNPKDKNGKNSDSSNSTLTAPPLIDLDGICYGKTVSPTVYRKQWTEMQTNNPKKVLLNKNLHLTQAMIGRSLYVFPLEWWYVNFRPDPEDASTKDSITFVCTEDLNKADTLNHLTSVLGLPKHDGFDDILGEGAYNVGGHRGYDTATSWEDLELEHEDDDSGNNNDNIDSNSNSDNNASDEEDAGSLSATAADAATEATTIQTTTIVPMTNGVPLPEDLYRELEEFINPINERLFALTGNRCDW